MSTFVQLWASASVRNVILPIDLPSPARISSTVVTSKKNCGFAASVIERDGSTSCIAHLVLHSCVRRSTSRDSAGCGRRISSRCYDAMQPNLCSGMLVMNVIFA
jgi:hypothetical protein